jgi:hypothetical protein
MLHLGATGNGWMDGWMEQQIKNGLLYITSLFINLKNAFCRNAVFKK